MWVKTRRFFVLLGLSIVLAACGGGGGDSGGGTTGDGSLSVSPSSYTYNMEPGGSLPSAQNFNFSSSNPNTVYVFIGWSADVPVPGWASISSGSGNSFNVNITSGANYLADGVYTATARLVSTDISQNTIHDIKDVAITLRVGSVSLSQTTINFTSEANVAPATEQININYSLGSLPWVTSISYKSGSSYGWLNLNPASGSSLPATLTVSANAVAAGFYDADITFIADGIVKTVPVTYTVKSPAVEYVAPYYGVTNIPGTSIIRGFGFNSLSGINVSFGATPALSVNVISDTEIRATYPALAQGSYAVSVADATTTLPSSANLYVADAPNYAYAAIPRTGSFTDPIYDPKRKAIYILDTNSGGNRRLERYTFNGSSWTPSYLSVTAQDNDLIMGPTGDELLRLDWVGIAHINLDSFSQTAYTNAYTSGFRGTQDSFRYFGLANNGYAIGSLAAKYYRYDIKNKKFLNYAEVNPSLNKWIESAGDGSRVYFLEFSFTPDLMKYFDASTDTFVSTSYTSNSNSFSFAAMDQTASKIAYGRWYGGGVFAADIYDGNFNLLGHIPVSDGIPWFTATDMVISNDGSRGYIWLRSTNTIHTYDLNSIDSSGNYVEIGSGTTLAVSPTSGTSARMTLTPDGGSLIIVGNANLIILPAP